MEESLNALQISDLTVDFGNFAIKNLNLNIKKGAVTGLIGANGAGKSTLIKAIMRAVRAQSGNILYDNKPFAGNEKEILNRVACVFDEVKFNLNVKPSRIIKLYKDLYSGFNAENCKKLMAKFNLPENVRIRKYSFGMKKKFLIILGLCQGADLLILDEPTSGVDPYDRNEIITLIQEYLMDENKAVLFSTHITEDLDNIADYIVMMDNGRIILNEGKDDLIKSYRIVRAATLTPELEACAIGIVKDMFGYTFITKDTQLENSEGIQVTNATVQQIFVHLLGQSKSGYLTVKENSESIFGI